MTTIRLPQWGCEVHSFDDYRRIYHMEPIRNYQRKLKQTNHGKIVEYFIGCRVYVPMKFYAHIANPRGQFIFSTRINRVLYACDDRPVGSLLVELLPVILSFSSSIPDNID